MTPTERIRLRALAEEAQRVADGLWLALGEPRPFDMGEVPLAVARKAWGISKEAAIKRASRGLGRKVGRYWYVSAAALPALQGRTVR